MLYRFFQIDLYISNTKMYLRRFILQSLQDGVAITEYPVGPTWCACGGTKLIDAS